MSDIKTDVIVNLKDEQTLEELMDDGKVLTSMSLTSGRVRKFTCNETGIVWEIVEFKEDDNLYLIKKTVDDESDTGLYFVPDQDMRGSREDFIEKGFDFIFDMEDDDPPIDDIEYARIIHDDEANLKFVNELGTTIGNDIVENGKRVEDHLFLITEWSCEKDCDNPELFCLEYSSTDEGAEGFILFLQGCIVNEHDVQILP